MRWLMIAGVCLVALAIRATPAWAIDLSVTSVEVTQATQLPGNTISLVARRSTAVRATVGVADNGGGPASGVTGRLHVFREATEITPAAGVPPINPPPWAAPASPDRANENDTLNFELPASVLSSLTASSNAAFRVDVQAAPGESNTSNNSGAANGLRVVVPTTPQLFFTRINYSPAGLGLPSNSFIAPGSGDAFVKGILPVNDNDANLYRQGLFPSLTFRENSHGDGRLGSTTDCYSSAGTFVGTGSPCPAGSSLSPSQDGNHLISLLGSCRQLIVNNGLGANNTTFLFGWLAGNPINGNGLGQIGGRNAFGNTDPIRGQRSYAHELTHNLGFDHITQTIDQIGWDVGARLQGNPSGNNTTGHLKPTTFFDIQVGGQLTNSAWVRTDKYQSLLSNTGLGFGGSGGDQGDILKRQARRRVAVIEGIVDPTGRRILQLKPVFRFPWLSQPTTNSGAAKKARYRALIRTTAGRTIQVPFNAGVHDDSQVAAGELGFFEVLAPVSGEIQSLQIFDRSAPTKKQRLAAITRSRRAPQIKLLSPRPGAKLGKRTTVRWRVFDPDTPRSRLMFQVAYSPDSGRHFVPIAVDLRRTSVTFDSTQIQRSRRRGLIRVFVSDGLHTSSAQVSGLTSSAAQFP